jgi:hypothetical protein
MCRETETNRKCVHHWIIASPNGKETISGMCKLCGRNRQFPAVLERNPRNMVPSRKYHEKLHMEGAWL